MVSFEGGDNREHIACIFGIDIYFGKDLIEQLKKEIPDEGDYKKFMNEVVTKLIPVCRRRSEMK